MLMAYVVLTVLGDDRPGLVEALSDVIAAHGGNWLESRMARLAGKFAGVLRASVPESSAEALTSALQDLEARGLHLIVEWSTHDDAVQEYRWLQMDLIGTDHPGIVRDISRCLATRGINIAELRTEYGSAPMTGEMLFKATAQLQVPLELAISDLQEHLESLAQTLMVDMTLEDISPKTQE
jgi:glycine cleavage system regulatory protein